MKPLLIGGRAIGPGCPPYVVAELSANHNGSLERALRLVEVASAAGADAVKLQTYRADTLTIKSDAEEFRITEGLWAGKTLYELYEWAHMPWEWHEPLFARARELGLAVFSSPFDCTAVELLERLNAPAYKIASLELVDLPLIRYAAATGKPLILSTGAATAGEIQEAVVAARGAGCGDLALLHCVSAYPAEPAESNLKTIPDMERRFRVPVGLSDHTKNNTTAIAANAICACIIEKHFTLSRNDGGPDDSCSLEPDALKDLCRDVKTIWSALGKVNYSPQPGEQSSLRNRRSLYAVAQIPAGTKFTKENVRSIRPGYGLPPKFMDEILGKKATRDIGEGDALEWGMVGDD